MTARAQVLGVLPLLLVLGCATRQPIEEEREASGPDRKLSTHAYIEQGELVTLIVDTRPARDRDESPYMPLEVSVANNGLKQLRLSRESFTLLDKDHNRYPMATARELIEGYPTLDFDRRLMELEGIVFNKFAAYTRYPCNFTPSVELEFGRSNVVRDLVSLPRFGYMIDFLVFPTPPGGIRDRSFELFIDSPDLEDPVFVRFEVR